MSESVEPLSSKINNQQASSFKKEALQKLLTKIHTRVDTPFPDDFNLRLQVPPHAEEDEGQVSSLIDLANSQPESRSTAIVVSAENPGGALAIEDVRNLKKVVGLFEVAQILEKRKIAVIGREDIQEAGLSNNFGAANRFSSRIFFLPSCIDKTFLFKRVKEGKKKLKRLYHQAQKSPSSQAIFLNLNGRFNELELRLLQTHAMNLAEICEWPLLIVASADWIEEDLHNYNHLVNLWPR